jgi:hypothetical protein
MEMLQELAAWAWARHHNPLSWYIRPLFLLPFCWFAWRRSAGGIALTLLALATSMAWFPAPQDPPAGVVEMLEAERRYLAGAWTLPKILVALLVPLSLAGLATAFWHRSPGWGLAVVNAMVLTKIAWSFVVSPLGGALAHLAPALLGLAVVDAALLAAWWRWRGAPPAQSSAGKS